MDCNTIVTIETKVARRDPRRNRGEATSPSAHRATRNLTVVSTAEEREPLAAALERVGDRWTLLLVHALLDGPSRFGELQDRLDGISPNILSQRLKQLEADGLVIATPYQDRPVRYDYELTEQARDLAGPLRLLAQWGAAFEDGAAAVIHAACGTPAEARWWCPTCEREVADETTHLTHL